MMTAKKTAFVAFVAREDFATNQKLIRYLIAKFRVRFWPVPTDGAVNIMTDVKPSSHLGFIATGYLDGLRDQ